MDGLLFLHSTLSVINSSFSSKKTTQIEEPVPLADNARGPLTG